MICTHPIGSCDTQILYTSIVNILQLHRSQMKLPYYLSTFQPRIRRWFAPGFTNHKTGCTRFAIAGDNVYPLVAHSRWFSSDTPTSSTTNTGRHDIADILLKVALNTINQIKSINHLRQHESSLSFIQISNFELKVLIFTADVVLIKHQVVKT